MQANSGSLIQEIFIICSVRPKSWTCNDISESIAKAKLIYPLTILDAMHNKV